MTKEVSGMKQNTILICVIVAIVCGGLGFVGGQMFEKIHARTAAAGMYQNMMGPGGQVGAFGRQNGTGGRRFGNGTNRPVIGTIVSQDATSITVKMQDGSTKIIDLTDKTTYQKTDTASTTDLKSGETVAASGATNSDGSLTATNVQINPMFGRMQSVSPTQAPAQ